MANYYGATPSVIFVVASENEMKVKNAIAEAVVTALHSLSESCEILYCFQEHDFHPGAAVSEWIKRGPGYDNRN